MFFGEPNELQIYFQDANVEHQEKVFLHPSLILMVNNCFKKIILFACIKVI